VITDGFVFEREDRPGYEVMLEPIQGVRIENPAYDATPVELIDEVLTDDGVREF
jgi:translation initiation factor eIF-2B subunit delta